MVSFLFIKGKTMPKFLDRMSEEDFIETIQSYTLEQLVNLNKSYYIEFIKISSREDNANAELDALTIRLSLKLQRLEELKAMESEVEAAEEQWQKLYQPVECSRTERYMHRNAFIGCSPAQSHRNSQVVCYDHINLITELIKKVQTRIENIATDKKNSIKELTLINKQIDIIRNAAAPIDMAPSHAWQRI